MLKTKRKSFITLIELLISMALTAIILTILFYFYRDVEWLNQNMSQTQRDAFRISYLQNRLSDILPKTISPRILKKDFFFYTTQELSGLTKPNSPTLVFIYDFGANRDPLFGGQVLGRLYVDSHDNLALSTLPPTENWTPSTVLKMKNEILAENVESLAFSFYVPPEKNRSLAQKKAPQGIYGGSKRVQAQDLLPKDAWHTDWKNEYYQLPAMIKITIKFKNIEKPMTFLYPFPLSDFTIIYDK